MHEKNKLFTLKSEFEHIENKVYTHIKHVITFYLMVTPHDILESLHKLCF